VSEERRIQETLERIEDVLRGLLRITEHQQRVLEGQARVLRVIEREIAPKSFLHSGAEVRSISP
jgi:hypothetical protein